ncbi:MAG: FAD-binding protein [Clostridia bacterium]|nr:FAD-binding protein [Clostridia bacterium]
MIYDVVVVGAGPAGSTFARVVASGGYKVLLIDGQNPEKPKPCGGLLAPDAQKLFARFDFTLPKEVLADPQIFSVKTADLVTRRVRYYPRYYLNMDRYRFDDFLLSLVPNSVEVVKGRVERAERREDGFRLALSVNGEERVVSAKRIVGADGASSIVRRTFFSRAMMQYVSIQESYPAGEKNPFYSCIFDSETSESCSWMLFKGDVMIYGGAFLPNGCREAFEKQRGRVADFFGVDLSSPVSREACLVMRPRKWRDFVTGSDGVWLIGEAAGFISASSFEGISSAIISGTYLAEAFLKTDKDKRISRIYSRLARPLKRKLWFKIIKHWFMYTPLVRRLIMASGITSIKVEEKKK